MATQPLHPGKHKAGPAPQPFQYPLQKPFVEPDWTRLPGYRGISKQDWESGKWQRQNSVKDLKELKEALGLLPRRRPGRLHREGHP